MQKITLPLVACLLAIAATGACAQSVWKWRDSSGQLHISDTAPPTDVPQKNIMQRPTGMAVAAGTGNATNTGGQAAAASAPAGPAGDSDLQKKKLKADKEKADKTAADKAVADQKSAAVRAENCSRAQAQAKALQSGVRIARMNASGEREYLDDAGRAAEMKRTQDIVSQSCGAAPLPQ